MTFKPMLAGTTTLEDVKFPVIASPKLDGIRAVTGVVGAICSRTLKEIPNQFIRDALKYPPFLDGELLTYTDGVVDTFSIVQSKVMSVQGSPDFIYHVFDFFKEPDSPFTCRLKEVVEVHPLLRVVPHIEIHTEEELKEYEKVCVDVHGYEGIMVRKPSAPYKFGRSTKKEGYLLKIKRFDDSEALIKGTTEEVSISGTKKGTLGSLLCEWRDTLFEIGSGFTAEDRVKLWDVRESLVGTKVTFKYQGIGSLGRPRFPIFIGLRYDI
jgi:DNA ligase-1